MYHGRRVPGFPQHPHRGFETVTFVRRGFIDHCDSLGATARFGRGDAQWLTAGGGIVHCGDVPAAVDRDGPNPLELFQIWLNLPAPTRWSTRTSPCSGRDDIPGTSHRRRTGRRHRWSPVAGTLGDRPRPRPRPTPGPPAPTPTWPSGRSRIDPGARWALPRARGAGHGAHALLLRGRPAHGRRARAVSPADRSAGRSTPPTAGERCGDDGVELLLLQGRPIGEPVAQHGPFVMNTEAEIAAGVRRLPAHRVRRLAVAADDPVHGPTQAASPSTPTAASSSSTSTPSPPPDTSQPDHVSRAALIRLRCSPDGAGHPFCNTNVVGAALIRLRCSPDGAGHPFCNTERHWRETGAMDSAQWDDRYSTKELIWTGRANQFVEATPERSRARYRDRSRRRRGSQRRLARQPGMDRHARSTSRRSASTRPSSSHRSTAPTSSRSRPTRPPGSPADRSTSSCSPTSQLPSRPAAHRPRACSDVARTRWNPVRDRTRPFERRPGTRRARRRRTSATASTRLSLRWRALDVTTAEVAERHVETDDGTKVALDTLVIAQRPAAELQHACRRCGRVQVRSR